MHDRELLMLGPEPTVARRRFAWKAIAAAVLVLGVSLAAVGGLVLRSSARTGESRAFDLTAGNVTTTLATLLRRYADFTGSVGAVLTMEPDLTPTEFANWYQTLHGRQQQVESLGTVVVRAVPAGRLAAFLERRNADRTFRALVGSPAPVARNGDPQYCLLAASGELDPSVRASLRLAQSDWCSPSSLIGIVEGPLLKAASDTGQLEVFSSPGLGRTLLMLESPFYRLGAPLASVADRRRAVRGWTVSAFDSLSLIRLALGANSGYGVTLYHRNPGQGLTAVEEAGAPASRDDLTRTTNVKIDSSWAIKVRGRAPLSGLSPDLQGLLAFGGGSIVSVLAFILVIMLGTSRERALRIVEQQTGELRHLALHDSLTGLPNRVLALDRAEQMLARARRSSVPAAALYIDIDGFKQINDTFGHQAGDEFLRLVASRLDAVIRDSDTAARLSGDEFAVLLDGATTLDVGPELVAERLLEVLREPYELNGRVQRSVTLTASIGVAHSVDGTSEELLAAADIALNEAKSRGKDRAVVFQSGMHTAAQVRLNLEMDLADALAQEQLFLVYQPTFELASERVVGVEALLRWQHPERGLIRPDVFIPIAEESGLIISIGRWVLEQACVQAAHWRAQGHEIGMSVNVSARQLDRDDLIEDVQSALTNAGLEPGALTLEITETTLMRDAEAATERMAALKRLGVRIAIDDFGTGYSSLAYLRQFPVDALKIDRSFISGIAHSKQAAVLTQTLVRLGKTLELETLAEGIEDVAQLGVLRRQHCHQGQGFLFARPLEAEAIEQFLAVQGQSRTAASAA
jgi:diguanylate cyclase (GGDEF)-like protein